MINPHSRSFRTIGTVTAIIVIAVPALAQDAADWDLTVHDRQKVTVATIQFSNGLGIAVRCVEGSYEAFMEGLPAAAAAASTRTLRIGIGDEPVANSTWTVADEPTIAVSSLPAPFARSLRRGGRLQVVVPGAGENGRNLRYVMDLPESTTAIDQTLATCNRPLADPRDGQLADMGESGLPGDLVWSRAPRPSYPGASRYASGFAVLSCLTTAEGSLRDCVVESEHPHKGRFGQAALRSTGEARLALAGDVSAPVPLRQITFRTNFRMAGGSARTTGRRINPSPTAPVQPDRDFRED